MKYYNHAGVPGDYKRAVAPERRGSVTVAEYRVHNYINSARQFVTNQRIDSKEAGRETISGTPIKKQCNVYLPSGYKQRDTATRYNVLYLLHGVGGDHDEWLGSNGSIDGNPIICNILDNLIDKGEIDPLIVVFPNGRSAEDFANRAFDVNGTNLLGFYYFDYELRYDLIPFIESEFNTYAGISEASSASMQSSRMHRAIAGLSMGGMQALNLILGGYRCDSARFTGGQSPWNNGLDATVLAPGMTDLFAYVGAFSNAPTSSDGRVLGSSIGSQGNRLQLLYMTCGDADDISMSSYAKSTEGLVHAAGGLIEQFFQVQIQDGVHDFRVWNHGAVYFARSCFKA